MGDRNVTSFNQQAGVTAYEVHTGKTPDSSRASRSWMKLLAQGAAIVAAVSGIVFGILKFL